MTSTKTAKNRESRVNRALNWTEKHEGWFTLIVITCTITFLFGARSAFLTYAAYCGRENAKTYVAQNNQRTFTQAKWWMFQNRVELFEPNQTDGQGLSVPVNTEFGSKIYGEFLKPWINEPKDPNLKFPITVKITYNETPQNIWTDSTNTHDYLEGAYLHFEIASQPPTAKRIAVALD